MWESINSINSEIHPFEICTYIYVCVQRINIYLKEKLLRVNSKEKSFDPAKGDNRSKVWKPYETNKCIML